MVTIILTLKGIVMRHKGYSATNNVMQVAMVTIVLTLMGPLP